MNNRHNKNNGEIEMWRKQKPQDIQPDSRFRMQLEREIMEEIKQTSIRSNYLKSLKFAYICAGIAVSVFVFVIMNGFGGWFSGNTNNQLNAEEILTEIAANNPKYFSRQKNHVAALANDMLLQSGAESAPDLWGYDYWPGERVYTYSRQTKTVGPAVNSCTGYVNAYPVNRIDQTIESFSYQGDGHYYYVNTTRNGAQEIMFFDLTTQEYSVVYMGGEYAVKMINPPMLESRMNYQEEALRTEEFYESSDGGMSVPGSPGTDTLDTPQIDPSGPKSPEEEIEPDQIIENMFQFGEDVQVNEVEINGEKYYQISYSDTSFCVDYSDIVQNSRSSSVLVEPRAETMNDNSPKVVHKLLVNQTNFQITQEEVFLSEILPRNLIVKTEYQIESRETNYEDVRQFFTYDLPFPLREIILSTVPDGYNNPEEYYLFIDEYLRETPIPVIVMANDEFKPEVLSINGIYENDDYRFYSDRTFYLPGELGDEMFKLTSPSEQNYVITALVYAHFTRQVTNEYLNDNYVSLEIYPGQYSYEEIKMQQLGEDTFHQTLEKQGTINVQVEGRTISAQYYTFQYENSYTDSSAQSNEGLEVSESPDSKSLEAFRQTQVTFKDQGFLYVLDLGLIDSEQFQSILVFDVYNTSLDNERADLINIIKSTMVERPVLLKDEPTVIELQ